MYWPCGLLAFINQLVSVGIGYFSECFTEGQTTILYSMLLGAAFTIYSHIKQFTGDRVVPDAETRHSVQGQYDWQNIAVNFLVSSAEPIPQCISVNLLVSNTYQIIVFTRDNEHGNAG